MTERESSRRLVVSYTVRANILQSPLIFVLATGTGLTRGSKYAIRIQFLGEFCYLEYQKNVKT